MKTLSLLIIAVVLNLFLFTNFSHPATTFSTDESAFLKELHTFFQCKKDKNSLKLVRCFEQKLQKKQFSQPEFEKIVTAFNQMAEHQLPAKPYFSTYLQSVCSFGNSVSEESVFIDWHEVIRQMLTQTEDRNIKQYQKFLQFSYVFFDKKLLRASKSGTNWRVKAPQFRLLWEEKQPIVRFKSLDLVAFKRKDSISIEHTTGEFHPLTTEWQGKGGKVSWSRLDEQAAAYAILNQYKIDMKKGDYTAKNVQFFHQKYFGQEAVLGTLKDRIANNSHNKKGTFPKFAADDKQVVIDNLGQGLSYQGGFALYGLMVLGVGNEQKAVIEQLDAQNKALLRFSGDRFMFKNSGEIVGRAAAFSLYFDQDSIYHPGINIKYKPEEQLILYGGEKAITKSPFYDSYHQLMIYTDQIDWNPKENTILISPSTKKLSGKERITLESVDYYNPDYFYRIQNIADYHPLVVMKSLSEKEGTSTFDVNFLAKKIHPTFSESNIKSLLFELEQYGFLHYFPKEHKVQLKNKVFQYVDASIHKIDFDALKIISKHGKTNGQIDLNTKMLNLNGVTHVPLHIRQKVGIKPHKKQIHIAKNRQTSFDGKTFAGYGTFIGKNMVFDYNKYRINMDSIQFFDLFLEDKSIKNATQSKAVGITSRIENTAGILLVNAPENKSGKEWINTFPSFQSTQNAYVYYDLDNKQGDTCYAKENFYFELDKFSFNGLSNFTEKDLHFKGTMVSAKIFPEFQETLVYQTHDRSLGFVTTTPAEGFPSYQSKGNFKGTVQLSNRGFEGKGELEYEATILKSEDIVFKPEQAVCTAETFHLREDAARSIPEALGEEVTIDWLPQQDSMFITSQKKSFQLFKDGEHQIGGMLIYTPDGLKGKGIFEWSQGEMSSNLFSFGNFSVMTEKTDLKINTLQTEGVAFDTRDLNGNIDFEKKKGRFKANNATAVTTMPYNQYITTLNEFEWDLGKKALTLVAEEDKKGIFISTHPDQDSLQYEGKSARYDFETSEMNIDGVSFILAADALIYPEKEHIKIDADGGIKTLKNASILANFQNKYHQIHHAKVNIKSRKEFSAQGFYDYAVNDKKQTIHFTNIIGTRIGKGKRSEKATATMGSATITKEKQFYLDAKTRFQGDISFQSSEKNLNFKGFAQLDVPVLKNQKWFSVAFSGDKNNLLIDNKKPKNKEGEVLHTGIFIGKETQQTYSSVLMPLLFKKDRSIFNAEGVFQFRPEEDAFVFGDSIRLAHPLAKGNQMILSRQDASLNATGQFNICPNIRGAKLKVLGQMKTGFRAAQLTKPELEQTDLNAHWVAAFYLGFPKHLQKVLLADILKSNIDAPALAHQNPKVYTTALAHLMPAGNKRDKAISQFQNRGIFHPDFGKEAPSFLLSELKMKWQPIHQSFVLTNNEVGISSVEGQVFQKKLHALLEFHQPSNGDDRFCFYLESKSNYFYYFHYKKGILHICSDNPAFKEAFKKLNKADKVKVLGQGETYELQWTTTDIVSHFRTRMGR